MAGPAPGWWRRLLPGAVVTALLWAIGLHLVHAVLLGLATLVVTAVVRRLDPEPDPVWDPVPTTGKEGARRELSNLSWTMTGRDGRVGERGLRGLQGVAESRLARHGLQVSLQRRARDADGGEREGPDDRAARTLLGARAWDTLVTSGGRLPRLADVQHVVAVLERLGPTRAPAPPAGGSAAGPAEFQPLPASPASGRPSPLDAPSVTTSTVTTSPASTSPASTPSVRTARRPPA